MKNIVLLVVWCVSVYACAQKQKETSLSINIRNQHINKDNVVQETLKHIGHFEKEPQYFIRPIQNNCIYEILVNDYLVHKDYSLEVLATPVEINDAILKSGEQTLTVRMYPLGNLLKDNYDTGNTITTLLDNTSMKIEVVKYDAYNISHRLSDEKTVLTHYSPTKEGTKKFIGSGLPYYEYTFSFDAEVPYENEGWLNGEDLTKFDKKELENRVIEFYNNYKTLIENKDLDNLIRLDFDEIQRSTKAYYQDKQYVTELWDELYEDIYYQEKEFQPIKDYNIEFYGGNKIITLRYPVINPIDKRLKGKSAFWFKYKLGGNIRASWTNIYLYIPKGGTLADLQTIR